MPIKKAAKKSMRADQKREIRNTRIKSELKTLRKKALVGVTSDDKDSAKKAVSLYCKRLDMAAQKNIIHKNNAARKKSRVMQKLSA